MPIGAAGAIELDGEVHNNVIAAQYDIERDLFLRHTGIKVLRFENRVVFENSEGLLAKVKEWFGWSRDFTVFAGNHPDSDHPDSAGNHPDSAGAEPPLLKKGGEFK